MMFAVPIVFRRPNALASHHINHSTSNVRADITILRKNKPTNRKKALTLCSPNDWHNLHSHDLATNLSYGAILMGPGLLVSHKYNV